MRGMFREVFVKGAASGISSILLRSDLQRLLETARRVGGLDEAQLAALRVEIEETLRRTEEEGREQRALLLQVVKELVSSWLPKGPWS